MCATSSRPTLVSFVTCYPRPPKPTEDTEPINPQSDKQMIEAFRAWGVELPDYRGKTLAIVQLETDRDEVRACIAQILDYKRAQKLLDAFGESLLQKIGLDGRLRGNNNQIGTATGRPSGYDPNLYQMPRMRVYREIFIPAEGMLFVICDYSQMEMRIVAQLSGDTNLAAGF
jgi:DNA polymerase-1